MGGVRENEESVSENKRHVPVFPTTGAFEQPSSLLLLPPGSSKAKWKRHHLSPWHEGLEDFDNLQRRLCYSSQGNVPSANL